MFPDRGEQRMVVDVLNDDRPLGADRFLNLRIALEIDAQIADRRVFVDRNHTAFIFARRRKHERAVRQPERLADAAHQCLKDFVGTQRRRDFLEDVEQEIAGA